jgi:peptidylprolyl isomerase
MTARTLERRLRRGVVFLAGLCLVAAAPPRAEAAEVVARVGGAEVTSAEIRAYLETLDPEEQSALGKDPALLSQVVRTYLTRRAVLQEARAKRWDQQAGVKARLERIRDQALAELYLDSVSQPPEGYPGEAEVQAAYQANREAFAVPRQYRMAQIFIASPKGAGKEAESRARTRLDEVARRLAEKGADFAALARSSSDDREAAQRGGEVGWLTEEQMVPGIRTTVVGLPKDAVSEPVRLDDGWHVLKLLDTRAASVKPLSEVRDAIAARLRAERAKASRQAYLARLLEQSPPAINELALSKVLPAGRPPSPQPGLPK